ncbi:MAG: tetratricopeptide repeat protein [Candidatus Acidiferrum sp.]
MLSRPDLFAVPEEIPLGYNAAFGTSLVNIRPKPGLLLQILGLALLTVSCVSLARAQEQATGANPAAEHYRAGVAAVSRNDLHAALENFQQVVRFAPSAEPGHLMLGFTLARLGRTKEAIAELEKALALNPNDTDARTNLALAFGEIGDDTKAISEFAKLEASAQTQGHDLSPSILAAYARSLAATRQWKAATAKMLAAVEADSRNAQLHDECGTLYAEQLDWTKAEQQFQEAIRLEPNLAIAHLHLGTALETKNEPTGLSELDEAYRLAPQNLTISLELAKALARRTQDDQAITVLQHALELSPKSIPTIYQLALAYQRTGKVQQAIPLLQKVVSAEPKNAGALTNLGLALCQTQQAKSAVPFLQRALSLSPGSTTAHEDLAAAFVTLGQYDDAVAELRGALKLAPNDPRLHYNLGIALKMQDDTSAAIPELQAAERLDPSAPEASYALGMIYTQTGRNDDAAQELNTSLKLRPENGEGWATLGSVYNAMGKFPEAAAALREAIRQLPDQADPHLTLAIVLAQQDHPAEAAAERKTAADLMRAHMNLQRAQVATNAGLSLLKSGSLQDAIIQFKDALSYDPNYVEAHLGLANALERQGNVIDAAAERQKASDLKKLPDPK